MLRAYSKLFHDPAMAAIDTMLALVAMTNMESRASSDQVSFPQLLFVSHFVINKLLLLLDKADYMLVSYLTAMKNRKQRFKGQECCFLLQFTLLLPFTLGVLVLTTLLDTATIPVLGFAFFSVGFPRPLRGWSASVSNRPSMTDSRSDGHLYASM